MSKPKQLEILICSRCGKPGSVFNLPGSICDGDHHAGDWERCKVVPMGDETYVNALQTRNNLLEQENRVMYERSMALNRLGDAVYGKSVAWTSANVLVEEAIARMDSLSPGKLKQWRRERGYLEDE